jgi:hypothetical protein
VNSRLLNIVQFVTTGFAGCAIGFAIFLASINIIPVPDSSFNEVPRWIVSVFGLVFILGGLLAMISQVFAKELDSQDLSDAGSLAAKQSFALLIACVVTLMTALLNWVAFAPGDAKFSDNLGLPFIVLSKEQSLFISHVMVASLAVVFDSVALFVWYAVVLILLKRRA